MDGRIPTCGTTVFNVGLRLRRRARHVPPRPPFVPPFALLLFPPLPPDFL